MTNAVLVMLIYFFLVQILPKKPFDSQIQDLRNLTLGTTSLHYIFIGILQDTRAPVTHYIPIKMAISSYIGVDQQTQLKNSD
jgi:hypothetical protein